MKHAPSRTTPALPSLFDGSGDDLFAGMHLGDGVYPEPTEEDRRRFRRIVRGGSITDEVTELIGT